MSPSDNEAVAGHAGSIPSGQHYGDRDTMPNSVSGSLEVNPFVGEGGAYDSVRPAYPDEAVAALIDAARSGRGVNAPGRDGPLRAADIGAGTGKMSELWARSGRGEGGAESAGMRQDQGSPSRRETAGEGGLG